MNNSQETKKTAIVFAINGLYAFCTYVSILSLFKHSPQLAKQSDIYIYVCDISDTDKKALRTLGNIKIIDYEIPVKIKQTEAVKSFSLASFARYECFDMLNKYERIIYLDGDILVQKELLPVFDLAHNGIGMIKEKVNVQIFSKPIDGFDFSTTFFNSGFIVLTNKLNVNYKAFRDFCYISTAKYVEFLNLPDQAIINFALQKYDIKPVQISNTYNMPASMSGKFLKQAKIIHSTGHRKFWNYYYFDEWYKFYGEWIKNDGTPVSIRKDSKKYQYFCRKFGLDKKNFFQLCPDFFKMPIKAIRFTLKFVFGIKY